MLESAKVGGLIQLLDYSLVICSLEHTMKLNSFFFSFFFYGARQSRVGSCVLQTD